MTAVQEMRLCTLLIKAFSCCGDKHTITDICPNCIETIGKVGSLVTRWAIPRKEYLSLAREIKKDYALNKEW